MVEVTRRSSFRKRTVENYADLHKGKMPAVSKSSKQSKVNKQKRKLKTPRRIGGEDEGMFKAAGGKWVVTPRGSTWLEGDNGTSDGKPDSLHQQMSEVCDSLSNTNLSDVVTEEGELVELNAKEAGEFEAPGGKKP